MVTRYDRFMEYVEPEPMSGCWLWTGPYQSRPPYPVFWPTGHWTTKVFAHRWILRHLGRLPKGKYVDHLCRVPMCVNPQHLEAVDFRTNVLRGIGPTAINAKKTHCPIGHDYSPRLRPVKGGQRMLRYCIRCNTRKKRLRYWEKALAEW